MNTKKMTTEQLQDTIARLRFEMPPDWFLDATPACIHRQLLDACEAELKRRWGIRA